MTKEILLSIKGLQFLEDNNEDEIEVITTGTYFQKDGRHYIKYDEVMEGLEGKIQNLIKINGKSMEVTKRGLSNVHMVFEENKKNVTYYDTPFGNLLVGIAATNIDLNESKDIIDVKVDYALEVNYEHLADCTISMNIQAKDMKRPHLLQ
ncbi:DUF1934 domain-containing protein [Murimonas intestini]|uniref:Uncharacterized beta-barrel protein YwiB (DUF1934 family) n=1 Tax=Murimonas intestini TaxID=1337051 RepID=A0AB73T4C2_9FIRM|nr:DUF1934 domain-containing protein [Murimonas intestini]MCR1840933.1 DUF1934 domain-containing protein [Murimonas intestini]MCR1865948.1 DUF1934 domain-containing protein [Murimonas intestini]MCR1883368.1 DUF1934 domain-containing protein [Murimonas intestini]